MTHRPSFTASFGGLVRDTFCAQPARILHSHQEAYASLALVGSCLYIALTSLMCPLYLRVAIPVLVVTVMRKAAWTCGLRLPLFKP
jgi:uncharacterized membrane protein YeiH